jgi:GTP-binding protein
MIIKTAKYITSSPNYATFPPETLPEFAFVGRSNVGKSSLINYLCNDSSLARVSKTPGKTRLFNHFLINSQWFLIDMPGYGYAKLSRDTRQAWGAVIEDYILNRTTMRTLFVLVDGSISPQRIDLEFIAWLEKKKVPTTVIITKTDKTNQKESAAFFKSFSELSRFKGNMFEVTANKKAGKEAILDHINQLIQ